MMTTILAYLIYLTALLSLVGAVCAAGCAVHARTAGDVEPRSVMCLHRFAALYMALSCFFAVSSLVNVGALEPIQIRTHTPFGQLWLCCMSSYYIHRAYVLARQAKHRNMILHPQLRVQT